jgi:hypothetical protein
MRKAFWAMAFGAGLLAIPAQKASAQVNVGIRIGAPPPAEVVETPPPRPGPGPEWVWIKGHHRWDGGSDSPRVP